MRWLASTGARERAGLRADCGGGDGVGVVGGGSNSRNTMAALHIHNLLLLNYFAYLETTQP